MLGIVVKLSCYQHTQWWKAATIFWPSPLSLSKSPKMSHSLFFLQLWKVDLPKSLFLSYFLYFMTPSSSVFTTQNKVNLILCCDSSWNATRRTRTYWSQDWARWRGRWRSRASARWTKTRSLPSTTGTATVLPSTHANPTSADVSSGSCLPVCSDSYCPVLKTLTHSLSHSFFLSLSLWPFLTL